MVGDTRREQLVGRRLRERLTKALFEWRAGVLHRDRAPQFGEPAVSQRLGRADDGGVTRAELLGDLGGRAKRAFRARGQPMLRHPPLRRRERSHSRADLVDEPTL